MAHIALFIPSLDAGGAERVFITLAHQFIQQGHQVDIVLINKQGALLKQCSPEINIIDLKSFKNFFGHISNVTSRIRKLSQYLDQKKPDILLSTLTGSNLVAVIAHKLCLSKSKLVLREACNLNNIKSTLRLYLMRKIYPLAEQVICLTDTMKSELIEQVYIIPDKIKVISNPVDLYSIRIKAKEKIPLEWQLKDIKFVLAIGRLTPQKDFPTLLKAFSLAYQKDKQLRLVILGEGKQRNQLESMTKKLSIQKQVYMPGYEENPYRWLEKTQMFVLTSKWEGYPNVLIEAMAIGVPIITTQYDASIKTIIKPYKQASITPKGDYEKLADIMLKNSQTTIEKTPYTLSIESITKQYLSVLCQ